MAIDFLNLLCERLELLRDSGNFGKTLKIRAKLVLKGARSRCFRKLCFILLVMSCKRQIGRARVFRFQNHGHITTENDFPAV